MSNSILVVEDHAETREMLKAALEDAGFRVACAGGVAAAQEYLAGNRPRMLILDIRLPDGNGLEICAHARQSDAMSDIPVIALTGQDELPDKKKGFDAGVDQYLTKPIVMEELLMWVDALLRRVSLDKCGGTLLKAGRLEMDVRAQLVKFRDKTVEDLTRREFELLYALVKNSPEILSRQEILAHVWRTVAVENLVDTHMFNLRKKLPPELSERIQSITGKGFRYYDSGL
ncbi:MAG: DNA-binding response regulator [Elusimicrobia bacterium HGW-Elusimicrobia-3]|jgi:DNA-binding response OmpR family regulator|nr:MAG: DNA-binding response regulator [Elusimicrobia bacterium HGW-Elusimicrobia-3]